MMLVPFIVLLLTSGILCSPHECTIKKKDDCDRTLIPQDYPETVEELQTMCINMKTFGACSFEVFKSCKYPESSLNEIREFLDFLSTACSEDNPINKVISSNLGCITPVARNLDDACNVSRFTEENSDAAAAHEDKISNNFTNIEVLRCLTPFWEVTCRSAVLGLHCGPEVKEAVQEILETVNGRYKSSCTVEVLDKLQPLRVTYESVLEMEHAIQNVLEKRK